MIHLDYVVCGLHRRTQSGVGMNRADGCDPAEEVACPVT